MAEPSPVEVVLSHFFGNFVCIHALSSKNMYRSRRLKLRLGMNGYAENGMPPVTICIQTRRVVITIGSGENFVVVIVPK